MQQEDTRPIDEARRAAIIKIVGGAVGLIAFVAAGYGLSKLSVKGHGQSTSVTTSSAFSTASAGLVQAAGQSVTTVRVVYFGMPLVATGTKKEEFTLGNPAYLSDLKAALVASHPGLKSMLPSMIYLVDGVSASGNPQLQDDVEVDILAQAAGG